MNEHTRDEARAAKAKVFEVFAPRAEVVGVGITRTETGYAVKVNLACPPKADLPCEVDGVPVEVEVVGAVRKRRD